MPPLSVRTNLETGASGTVAKVVRMRTPSLDLDEADRVQVELAVEVGDEVWQFAFAAVGAEVDRAFQRLVEKRAEGLA